MTDYYISAAGSDSNAGTSTGAPWKTFANTYGVTWKAGDRLLLRGGDTIAGMVWMSGVTATAANPITVGSYGTGRATIAENGNSGIYLQNCSHIVVQDLNVTGSSKTFDGVSVYNDGAARTAGITVRRCDVTGWKVGIAVYASAAGNGVDGVLIEDVVVSANLRDGLVISGQQSGTTLSHKNVTVRRVLATANTGDPTFTTSHSGSGIIVGCVDVGLVEQCEAHSNGAGNGWTGGGPVGIWAERARSVTIRDCASHDNRGGSSVDGAGFDLDIDAKSCVIERCSAWGNEGAGILLWGGATNTVRHCTLVGNGTANMYADLHVGSDSGSTVYGVTIVSRASATRSPWGVFIDSGTTGLKIYNSIIHGVPGAPVVWINPAVAMTNCLFSGCLYWNGSGFTADRGGPITGLAAWRSAGQESSTTGVVADPRMTVAGNGARVDAAAASPGIGTGRPYAALGLEPGPVDGAGLPMTSPPPIGSLAHPSGRAFSQFFN